MNLRDLVRPLTGAPGDIDEAVESARSKTFVLIGEATHGTHEFYRTRAEITKRLIEHHGFLAVAIEGDWPDAHRLHRYVTGSGDDAGAADALSGFRRFPAWMWRNSDVLDFAGWLQSYNAEMPACWRAGVFGLDLYSLHESMRAVIDYLEKTDPQAAVRARERYGCFDRFGPDVEAYARAADLMLPSCRDEVLEQLREMQRRSFALVASSSIGDDAFFAEQNARVAASAEEYYRTMLDHGISSWNLRDEFMFETLQRLQAYLARRTGNHARIVVWAHNSHVGDARATSMGAGREINIGQLVRQAYPSDCFTIGFATATGTVTAASSWYGDAERKTVRTPVPGSWEALFHSLDVPDFYLPLDAATTQHAPLRGRMLERAIGVIYRPQTELYSHYLEARLGEQFDALFYYDKTRALEPLERTALWETGEVPETYPTGV